MKMDIRGNKSTGFYVDTILKNGDRVLGAQKFDSLDAAIRYRDYQKELSSQTTTPEEWDRINAAIQAEVDELEKQFDENGEPL